ncbi:MAG: citramalate synthase [Planctomycetes bacterium]|nr:citramalate synthase [Planctomycetota bacterium]
MAKHIDMYDTTLRDGSQGEGVSFSVADKLDITRELDSLGINYIEGGWPGSNPKDMDYFEAVRKLKLKNAKVTAFGSTRHAKNTPANDPNIQKLVEAKTPVIIIFGKTWNMHVTDALRVSLDKNLEMINSSVKYLKKKTGEMFYDAEHFFDGYKANPEYAMKTLEAAADGGAEALVLCDTNGGTMPLEVAKLTAEVVKRFPGLKVGIHPHNDSGMAAANAVEAVRAGATHVQGTINGLGERTGNADLTQIIPAVELKLGYSSIGKKNLQHLTEVSRFVYEAANLPLRDNQPYVGRSAFAHKGGIHVSAMARNQSTYEHITPETVGNERRILISELSGRSNLVARSKKLRDNPEQMKNVLKRIMELENEGYCFESADASFDLLVQKVLGEYEPRFNLDSFRVISESSKDGRRMSEATVKVDVNGEMMHTVSEGDHGPVNALDEALRKAMLPKFPQLAELRLVDYKVHIVNAQAAAEARVRVVIEFAYQSEVWSTVGVSENIIDASCHAIVDSLEYMLYKYPSSSKKSVKRKATARARR